MHKVFRQNLNNLPELHRSQPLAPRLKNILHREKVRTVAGLVRKSEKQWLSTAGIGRKSLNQFKQILEDLTTKAAKQAGNKTLYDLPDWSIWKAHEWRQKGLCLGMDTASRKIWVPPSV